MIQILEYQASSIEYPASSIQYPVSRIEHRVSLLEENRTDNLLIDGNITTAQRRMQTIRDSLQKKEKQEVTIRQFCEFEGISFDEFYKHVKPEPGIPKLKY